MRSSWDTGDGFLHLRVVTSQFYRTPVSVHLASLLHGCLTIPGHGLVIDAQVSGNIHLVEFSGLVGRVEHHSVGQGNAPSQFDVAVLIRSDSRVVAVVGVRWFGYLVTWFDLA
jgi:hypothetical protein